MLSFSLAGNGEIDLSLVAKKPGAALDLDVARASIPLSGLTGADPLPPYVRLIHDVLLGDRSLFTRPGRAGRRLEGGRAAAGEPAAGRPLRARVVGAGRGPRAGRAGALAAGPVAAGPRRSGR